MTFLVETSASLALTWPASVSWRLKHVWCRERVGERRGEEEEEEVRNDDDAQLTTATGVVGPPGGRVGVSVQVCSLMFPAFPLLGLCSVSGLCLSSTGMLHPGDGATGTVPPLGRTQIILFAMSLVGRNVTVPHGNLTHRRTSGCSSVLLFVITHLMLVIFPPPSLSMDPLVTTRYTFILLNLSIPLRFASISIF